MLDSIAGGARMGTGLRHPDKLHQGELLDFSRVERIEAGHLLLLKAVMKIAGEAYLMFETVETSGVRSRPRSSALFRPRGLWGRVDWWMLLPIHKLIFSGLNEAIRVAQRVSVTGSRRPSGLQIRLRNRRVGVVCSIHADVHTE